jgi:hypothetical protein
MDIYNQKGIFTNHNDTTSGLEAILAERFSDYSIDKVGSAVIFTATK